MADTKDRFLDKTTDEDDHDLLCDLTEEELAELNESLGDDILSASEQTKEQTTKNPTDGGFNRSSLMEFLREEAKQNDAKVDSNYVPYEKKTRGKVWQPQEQKKHNIEVKLMPEKEKPEKKPPAKELYIMNGEDDELLGGLTEQELEELNDELDDDMLPARMR